MLCEICTNAFRDFRISSDGGGRVAHQASFAELKEAVDSGCWICFGFWNQYSDSQKEELCQREIDDGSATSYFFEKASVHDPENLTDYELWVTSDNLPMTVATDSLVVFDLIPCDDEHSELAEKAFEQGTFETLAVPKSWNTSSGETWDLISKWLERCKNEHPMCKAKDTMDSWYPSRLLNLDHTNQRARLLETSQRECTGPYLTLSYRWQNLPSFLLTTATHPELTSKDFPIASLPHVFRDAIVLCSRLNIDKLWIDALCIKQDPHDKSDWREQSLQMDKVYSNALLNISAAAANDGGCSLFATRNPAILPELITTAVIDGTERRFHVRNKYSWSSEVEAAPLNLRGWVFQERLLAQRVLRFGRSQVTWECAGMKAAESFPEGLPLGLINAGAGVSANFRQYLHDTQHQMSEGGRRKYIYQIWDSVIEKYSQCALTRAEDKLVALAGIAKMFARVAQTRYVAGMWRGDLENMLLWGVHYFKHDKDRPSRRSKIYRAPGWSWASLDGVVSASHFVAETERWEVVDVALDLVSDDEMGSIQDASLLLKCKLFKVMVAGERERAPWAEEKVFTFTGDDGESKKLTLCVDWDESEDTTNMAEQEAYIASAGYWEQSGRLRSHGLLLRHVVGDQAGTYRRCAYWQTPPGDMNPELVCVKTLQGALSQRAEVPCIRREENGSVIRLV